MQPSKSGSPVSTPSVTTDVAGDFKIISVY